ncbi:Uncharacterised protein [Leminorella richardii]|uniref:Lipoprotein n=1 Tax=Leminorella richardii TaxID=158841 RepID=A0A2X4UQP8_9GAMM|nr:hypothetical protein [Leminorella richardii]SQI36942.1 Uncharacterised protein [Leminorella richardii]
MKKCVLIVVALFTLLLAGCEFDKPEMTTEQFQAAMEAEGFTIDKSKDMDGKGKSVKRYLVAEKDGVTVNFLIYTSVERAIQAYTGMEKEYESRKAASNLTSSSKFGMGNYNKFTLRYNDRYVLITRIGSTMIFVGTQADRREWIAPLIEKMGY